MNFRLRFLPLFCCLILLGCGGKKTVTDPDEENGAKKTEEVEEDLGGPIEGEPTVEVWDWEQTLEAVHGHRGKVVVLHIWATWNETFDTADQADPMQREEKEDRLKKYGFDEFIRLKKKFRDDVVAIALNTDYSYATENEPPEMLKDKVLAFAKERGANFQHGISSVIDEVLLFEQLEIPASPATLVFDKQGELKHKFYQKELGEPYSYREDVIPLVEKLIKEPYTPPAPKPSEEENPKPSEEEKPTEENQDDPNQEENAAGEKVSLELGDWDDLQKRVANAKGKVVVVDLWSTECVPCLKEFPNLVKLHNEKKKDVACLSFNLNYIGIGKPEEVKPEVLEVLEKLNSTLPNIMSNVADEKIYAQIELASIPAVYVYDRAGKLRKRFDDDAGEFTYEKDILPLVNTLIAEKP